ncbi:MAG: hypothetical protein KDD21_00270 [Bacteroidetes bacterium]|nr:hypothetical protein [Bacteroidota bacterium]
MEQLIELVNIINKRKLSQVEILDKSLISRKDTLFSKLYDGIANGEILTDKDAVHYLYNSNGDDKKDNAAFRKLKSRFKTRLLNTLYFIDVNNSSSNENSRKDYFECVNSLYLSNILLRYTENRNASINIVIDAYSTAKKNNFFDILKEYSYKLLVHYGMTGNQKKYNEEYKAYLHYTKEYEWEQQAQVIYTKVMMTVHYTKQTLQERKTIIQDCIKEIEQISSKSKSLVVYFIYIRTLLFYYEIIGNNEKITETCDKYLKQYKKYYTSILAPTYRNTIRIYKIKSLFDERKYENALETILQAEEDAKGASFLAVKEFEIKIYLNTKNTIAARKLIQHLISNNQYKVSSPILKERWFVYNAYLEFLENYLENGNYKFSLSKFVNDIPILFQDKSGFNLSAKIITLLFHIGRNDLDNATQHVEALRVYQNRHLKDDSSVRCNLFLKLLMMMEKKSFNYKELSQLSEHSLLKEMYRQQIVQEGEIIFYDLLWEILLDILHKNDLKILGVIK